MQFFRGLLRHLLSLLVDLIFSSQFLLGLSTIGASFVGKLGSDSALVEHEDEVHGHVAQTGCNEGKAELVADFRISNHVCEAPQMVGQHEYCAIVENFDHVRMPGHQWHEPESEDNGGQRGKVQQGDLHPEVLVRHDQDRDKKQSFGEEEGWHEDYVFL